MMAERSKGENGGVTAVSPGFEVGEGRCKPGACSTTNPRERRRGMLGEACEDTPADAARVCVRMRVRMRV